MSSEVNKLRARFEANQAADPADTSSKKVQQSPSKVKGKKPPPPAKNPQLASKAMRDKLNATIATQDSHSTHKPIPTKRSPPIPKKNTSDELSSSPGLSALANVLQHSPKSQHRTSNGAPGNLSPPCNKKGSSPVLRATGKTQSADLPEPATRTLPNVPRPHSSAAGAMERGGANSPGGVGAANKKPLSSNNTTKQVLQGVNIPSSSSPPLSGSCGHLSSAVEESGSGKDSFTTTKDLFEKSASLPRPHPRNRVEIPKPSTPPPAKVKFTSDIAANFREREKSPKLSRRPPPIPTPAGKPPPSKPKPPVSSKPKPPPPPKPSGLKEDPRVLQRRSLSPGSSREATPDPDINKAKKPKSATLTSKEEDKTVSNSFDETLKAPLPTSESEKSDDNSWVLISESQIDEIMNSPHHPSPPTPTDKKKPPPTPPRVKSPGALSSSSSSGRRSATPQSAGVDGPRERVSSSPQSPTPAANVVEIKDEITSPTPPSPTITIIRSHSDGASSKSPKRCPKQSSLQSGSGRGNIDSGFSDDMVLGREISVEGNPPEPAPETPLSPEVWDEARLEKARTKRRNIAQELLDTEKTYVDRLRMIAVDFYDAVQQYNQKKQIPESAIFLNIRQIHKLNENILQEIQTRMENWETHEALGDVLCRLAPFLKLYALYTSGFEDAMKTFTEWSKKDRKFDTVVKEFERDTISTGLGVAHYMLEPVQRIPRYRLLLADYLKYLPPDSPDKPDTEKALKLISEAADRTNNRIKELENSNEILSIQRSITDIDKTLLIPSRIFLKKGSLQKFSRKTMTPRMFFLFSDCLLHTQPSGADVFKFRNEMPIFGMQVEEPIVSLVAHSFNVHSTTRSLILVANSEEEKHEWIEAIQSAISDDAVKRSSLRRDAFNDTDSATQAFGSKAPIMVPDKSVTMCQTCSAEFTFTFRRHHCRACGKVVCGTCSQWKVYLTYCQKNDRVCTPCYDLSQRQSGGKADSLAVPSPKLNKHHSLSTGVLNLKGLDEDAVMAGYVLSQDGRRWNRMWYQIKRDYVLYKFRAHEDIKAVHSMPLPGYRVSADQGNSTIHLIHPSSTKKNLSDTFKVDDPTAFDHWVSMLERAAQMDLPSPSSTPLAMQSFERSGEFSSSSRPVSTLSSEGSHPDSFETYDDSDSRPNSFREASPEITVEGSVEKST